jgi:hypothetical protein
MTTIALPGDSDKPEDTETSESITHVDEHFVFHAGHKFFLLYALWIRSRDNLFETSIDGH